MRADHLTMVLVADVVFGLLLALVSADSLKDREYKGRHVCVYRPSRSKPITQTYRKRVFSQELQRDVFQTAYRTVFKIEFSDTLEPGCCPGWAKKAKRDLSCNKPVCEKKCVHGRCVQPDMCLCDKGWFGLQCDSDENECLSNRHKCQQKCINTEGSYECACQEGFKLAEDNTSCVLCLTCSQEFLALQQSLQVMDQRIVQLEAEKQNLETNLTSAMIRYEEAIQEMYRVTNPATPDPPTSTPGLEPFMPLDRLASLSQQISILEEKMASCMCGDYML